MAITVKSKLWYSEQVLNELTPELRNRDEKIDPREVMIRIDAVVNNMAKLGVFESWNMGEKSVNDQFTTTWDGYLNSWLTVTDPDSDTSNQESYFTIPSNYVVLPKNLGIVQIYLEKGYFDPIAILTSEDGVNIRNTMANSLQGRLAVYPRANRMYFRGRQDISANYGGVGLRLVIRDSSAIADDAPYPIDAAMEHTVIQNVVQWFRDRKSQNIDTVRDSVDESGPKVITRTNG